MKEVANKVQEKIDEIMKQGINVNNLDNLYKLIDIYKDTKEVDNMYGNYNGYGNYGEYGRNSYGRDQYGDNYGRRGYDAKYRGEEQINRMYGEYGRYMENRNRYGASEETDKSFHYMVKALEDFIKVLEEEADGPQQKQQLKEALQNSIR